VQAAAAAAGAPRRACASRCCRRSPSAGSCRAWACGASAIPDIPIEIEASFNIIDLQRDGFHAAIRTGPGRGRASWWSGSTTRRRLHRGRRAAGRAAPERGQAGGSGARAACWATAEVWEKWFAAAGVRTRVTPVASFNDVGLMLQATEQGLGLAVVRELLAADALRDGRLARLFDVSVCWRACSPTASSTRRRWSTGRR
jgi:LysR family glycine cleavage system transcriptional activator